MPAPGACPAEVEEDALTMSARGDLIVIGGREDKDPNAERTILREVSRQARGGRLVLVTAATQFPEEVAATYRAVFHDLGVDQVEVLDIRNRHDACDPARVETIDNAAVIFFTGGDQLRITSQMGSSPLLEKMHRMHEQGTTIAGTSAGAAAMPETMLVRGRSDTNEITTTGLAPGLGLIKGVIIDSHFAERGRFGRLLGTVAQNPCNLGLGIDENTAIIVGSNCVFRVYGSGGVYIMDGSAISYTSLSEENPEGQVSIFDVHLHVLRDGDRFDLNARRPIVSEEPIARR